MSDLLIDPLDFCRNQREISGSAPVSRLDRVKTAVIEDDSLVAYHVAGSVDSLGRAVLSVRVMGEVKLVCQRCLEPMPHPLAIATEVTVFADEGHMAAAEADDPELEALLVDEARDLQVVVEDEILLALPFAPLHDECIEVPRESEDLPANNPFSVLASLKKGKSN